MARRRRSRIPPTHSSRRSSSRQAASERTALPAAKVGAAPTVHTAVRLFAAPTRLREVANDGQILLSSIVASLVGADLPGGTELVDLGIHRLRDLSTPDRIFELRSVDSATEARPLRSLDAFPNNLPIQPSSFVGRDRELAAVQTLLSRERLITLSGSGGCGKTRLAAQAAAANIERWRDGVWWVELQSVADPVTVAELVAAATGVVVEPVGGTLRSLIGAASQPPLPDLHRQLRARPRRCRRTGRRADALVPRGVDTYDQPRATGRIGGGCLASAAAGRQRGDGAVRRARTTSTSPVHRR